MSSNVNGALTLAGKDEEVKAEEEEEPVVHPNRIPGDRGVGFMPCSPPIQFKNNYLAEM